MHPINAHAKLSLAVPPPPPRQFTDEELKQQYGIHLATRLQTDENGKESKWADIDDDEDDWAPETVVWMDGTKSTLTTQEAAPMQKDQKQGAPQPSKLAEEVKPILAVKNQIELGPTKTILKPGASTAAAQARQNGSAAGTPTEKASLKATSPAPTPAKSPWAMLPPVDKISPINPPVQQAQLPQQQPFISQDARAYEPPPPPTAREIAADTFDRSWREGEGGTRELFNSANGRYEPAPETRRGSIKPDSSFRKPSVLQRPSQSAASPAEPSAAFQSRTSQVDGSWARRRGSSVSQGSGPPGRRLSMTKGPEYSPVVSERRTSTVIGHDLRQSPKMARTEPAQQPMFSQQSAWQQQMPPRPELGQEEAQVPVQAQEDPVRVQERVMREKRELARKRREEEEKRLEAEKQERLRARLAQLEGAGKSRREREAEAAAAQTPSSEQPPEISEMADSRTQAQAQPAKPAEAAAIAGPTLEAQSLPPAPDAAPPKQPSPEEKLPSPLPPKPSAAGLPDRPVSSADQTQRQQPRTHLSPRANARAPFQQQATPYMPPNSSYSSPGDRKQQPFGRSPLPNNDAFSPWPTTAPNGNVWGTSGIGNGTFESTNGFAPMPMSQQSSALPPPPGMTRPSTSTRISPQGLSQESRSPNLQQQSIAEPARGFAPPGLESRPDPFASQGRVNGASPAPGLGRQMHLPGPIAPPSRAQQQQQPPPPRQDPMPTWNNTPQRLTNQYRPDAEASERESQAVAPSPPQPQEDSFQETFRQTSAHQNNRLGGPRRYEKAAYTVHDEKGSNPVQSFSPAPPTAQTQSSGPFPTASPLQQESWKAAGENTVRIPDGSLNPAHGGLPTQQPPIGPPSAQQPSTEAYQANMNVPTELSASAAVSGPSDQSPPPPETSTHPVHSGDAHHPLVRLPRKPVVKLPPAPSPAQQPLVPPQSSFMLPQRPLPNWGPPGSTRPLVQQADWQQRFNGLFNRTPIQTETPPSPPKTPPKMQSPALAVASSSRTAMDVAPAAASATVSLPQAKKVTSPEGFTIDDSSDVTSKPTIEQMFNEELSFGSLPKINIPLNPVYHEHWKPTTHNMLRMGPNSKFMKGVDAQSMPEFSMRDIHSKRRDGYFVNLPEVKLVNRLIKFPHVAATGVRKPSGAPVSHSQEREVSAKFNNKTKGKEVAASATAAAPASPMPNGTSAGVRSRKTSFQKASAPTPAATESPATSAASPASEKKNPPWLKPLKGNNTYRRASRPVKAV